MNESQEKGENNNHGIVDPEDDDTARTDEYKEEGEEDAGGDNDDNEGTEATSMYGSRLNMLQSNGDYETISSTLYVTTGTRNFRSSQS